MKPSRLQQSLQWIPLTPPLRWLLPRTLHLLDRAFYRLTGGRYTFTSLSAGVPVLLVSTWGAKSGAWRTLPLLGVGDGQNIILIASNFGQKNAPGWYYNLKANPRAKIEINGVSRFYRARLVQNPQEYETHWQNAVQLYKGYALYKAIAGREIPMFVLEPE